MKVYRLTTQVQSTKTIQYIVEAKTKEEAQKKIVEGSERGEGEEVDDEIDWSRTCKTRPSLRDPNELDKIKQVYWKNYIWDYDMKNDKKPVITEPALKARNILTVGEAHGSGKFR